MNLAMKYRPKTINDIIGQDHLVKNDGPISLMLKTNKLKSFILFGKPGMGKTSIANVIKNIYPDCTSLFNASTDKKDKLISICKPSILKPINIIIVDEIHRMKKDIQDYLLPFLEDESVILIGLTTENPYITINYAIRSRIHIYKLNDITHDDLYMYLKDISSKENILISDEIINYIILASKLEIRRALNILELISLTDEKNRDIKNIEKLIGIKYSKIDDKQVSYYDILSALIKSIRGSDVDASIYYLARFLESEDLQMIKRRLIISAYEDIGLANPQLLPRIYQACNAALDVGLPEARIILSVAVIELATSPKSNSAYNAINDAINDLEYTNSYKIPSHILNREIKENHNYLYPHDFKDSVVKQQYMPDELKNKIYYVKKNNKYEDKLDEYYSKIKKIVKED